MIWSGTIQGRFTVDFDNIEADDEDAAMKKALAEWDPSDADFKDVEIDTIDGDDE